MSHPSYGNQTGPKPFDRNIRRRSTWYYRPSAAPSRSHKQARQRGHVNGPGVAYGRRIWLGGGRVVVVGARDHGRRGTCPWLCRRHLSGSPRSPVSAVPSLRPNPSTVSALISLLPNLGLHACVSILSWEMRAKTPPTAPNLAGGHLNRRHHLHQTISA
jgi:hypothetical protein